MYYAAEKNRIILFKRVRHPSVSGSAGKKGTGKFASFHLRYKRLIPCNQLTLTSAMALKFHQELMDDLAPPS